MILIHEQTGSGGGDRTRVLLARRGNVGGGGGGGGGGGLLDSASDRCLSLEAGRQYGATQPVRGGRGGRPFTRY
jgi:hypothetical protein